MDEISKYSALLDKNREQVYVEIITGEKPVDYFDTFVSEWKQNGGDKMVEAANEWYKTFE